MSNSPIVRIAGKRTECVACRLAAYRHKTLRDKRAIFYHLLWHRDEGDEVPASWLDRYDEDIRDASDYIPSGEMFGSVEHIHGVETAGTYGKDSMGRIILPAARGRLRPRHDRGGSARRKSVES